MNKKALLILLLVLALMPNESRAGETFRRGGQPKVVSYVDIRRYAGTWYEIANIPHRLQKDCFAMKVTYAIHNSDSIDVHIEYRKGGLDGRIYSLNGRGSIVDHETNAKLKFSFFWPFKRDCWIIDQGENYEYAVLGDPHRKYLWILSRSPSMNRTLFEGIVERLQTEQGYDTAKLVRNLQPAS